MATERDPKTRINSMRYSGFDYRGPGTVLVTICTHNRQRLFGHVSAAGELVHNEQGTAVNDAWSQLETRFGGLKLERWIIMPDHIHAIVHLGTDPDYSGPEYTLGTVVKSFKNAVQRRWSDQVKSGLWQPYADKLWQRDYFDSIIEGDSVLEAARTYVEANPYRWADKHR